MWLLQKNYVLLKAQMIASPFFFFFSNSVYFNQGFPFDIMVILLPMQETRVRSLGQEDPLEE